MVSSEIQHLILYCKFQIRKRYYITKKCNSVDTCVFKVGSVTHKLVIRWKIVPGHKMRKRISCEISYKIRYERNNLLAFKKILCPWMSTFQFHIQTILLTNLYIYVTLHHWCNTINSQLDATIIIVLIISISSTCFGRYFRPSSGALDCVYSL